MIAMSCGGEQRPPPPVMPVQQPLRDAAGNQDLRVMLAEVASAKACTMMKGVFRGLRDADRPAVTTGVLWIRDCKLTNDGAKLVLRLVGSGWQFIDQKKKQAGGTFVVHQYVKFDVVATIPGMLDTAYDQRTHVASLWFSPSGTPEVAFTPITKVGVDTKGAWSTMIGAVSSVVGQAPDKQGKTEAKKQGRAQFVSELSKGLSVTANLCTGLSRFTLGRPPKGELGPADVVETTDAKVELQPGGVMVFGPQLAPEGMSMHVDTTGPIEVGIACQKAGESFASAFLGDSTHEAEAIKTAVIDKSGDLKIPAQRCPVVVVARSVAPAMVTFDVRRPPVEIAQATGGAIIHCKSK